MAKRKSDVPTAYERAYRIIEYLKIHTDAQHTVSQQQLRKIEGMDSFVRNKKTFHDMIVNLADLMNFDEHNIKPEDQWRIVFNDFKKDYCFETVEEESDDKDNSFTKIEELYYNQVFTYDEINCLIEGIRFSRTLDTKDADRIIEKIENNLTTKFYKKGAKRICTVRETILADKERIRENLLTIQRAIDDKVQISFCFNGYNWKQKLMPVRENKDTVSPYYIVAYSGKYYLLASTEKHKNLSIWRIDLMTEIEIPKRNEKLGIKGDQALRKETIDGLPFTWDNKFPISHMNMSFDKPITIKMKIKSPKDGNDALKRLRVDYTFMYDWFSDTFEYISTEKEPPYDDIVKVTCSPYAMVNWALQYSDRVEVLEPVEVRNEVIKKINHLCEKYRGSYGIL